MGGQEGVLAWDFAVVGNSVGVAVRLALVRYPIGVAVFRLVFPAMSQSSGTPLAVPLHLAFRRCHQSVLQSKRLVPPAMSHSSATALVLQTQASHSPGNIVGVAIQTCCNLRCRTRRGTLLVFTVQACATRKRRSHSSGIAVGVAVRLALVPADDRRSCSRACRWRCSPSSHSSGTPLVLQSVLVPPARSHSSGTPLVLQSWLVRPRGRIRPQHRWRCSPGCCRPRGRSRREHRWCWSPPRTRRAQRWCCSHCWGRPRCRTRPARRWPLQSPSEGAEQDRVTLSPRYVATARSRNTIGVPDHCSRRRTEGWRQRP